MCTESRSLAATLCNSALVLFFCSTFVSASQVVEVALPLPGREPTGLPLSPTARWALGSRWRYSGAAKRGNNLWPGSVSEDNPGALFVLWDSSFSWPVLSPSVLWELEEADYLFLPRGGKEELWPQTGLLLFQPLPPCHRVTHVHSLLGEEQVERQSVADWSELCGCHLHTGWQEGRSQLPLV